MADDRDRNLNDEPSDLNDENIAGRADEADEDEEFVDVDEDLEEDTAD